MIATATGKSAGRNQHHWLAQIADVGVSSVRAFGQSQVAYGATNPDGGHHVRHTPSWEAGQPFKGVGPLRRIAGGKGTISPDGTSLTFAVAPEFAPRGKYGHSIRRGSDAPQNAGYAVRTVQIIPA